VWCDFEVMSLLLTVVVFLCESSRAFSAFFAVFEKTGRELLATSDLVDVTRKVIRGLTHSILTIKRHNPNPSWVIRWVTQISKW